MGLTCRRVDRKCDWHTHTGKFIFCPCIALDIQKFRLSVRMWNSLSSPFNTSVLSLDLRCASAKSSLWIIYGWKSVYCVVAVIKSTAFSSQSSVSPSITAELDGDDVGSKSSVLHVQISCSLPANIIAEIHWHWQHAWHAVTAETQVTEFLL